MKYLRWCTNMVLLHTPRLVLRDFRADDWRAVHAYASDPEVTRYMSWGPNDETASQAFVQAVMAGQNADPRQNYDLAITLKDNGKLIGGCGIYRRKFREGEMGYCLHRSYWSQGYMTEAAGALLEFAFTVEDYHRVYATCDPENIGSARVMEKIGMQREGRLRANMLKGSQWRDSLLYAILDWEWQELRGKA